MEKYTSNLTKGNISEKIITFSIPFVVGNLCMQLYNYADAVIIGKFIGKEALAGVGASSPIIFVLISFVMGITIGGGIIVSRFFVENDNRSLLRMSNTLNIVSILLGVVLTIAALLFCDDIIRWLPLSEDVSQYAVSYLRIYSLSLIPTFGYNAFTSMLRGVGNSKTPLYFLVATAMLNIVLDLLFVVVMGKGVEWVAAGSVISQILAYLLIWRFVNKRVPQLAFVPIKSYFDKSLAMESLRLGVPASIQQLLVSMGTVTLVAIVGRFGTDVMAAFTSAQRVLILIMVFPINISLALTTFTAQNYAAGEYDRVRKALVSTIKISSIVSVAILILLSMFSTAIMTAFTSDVNIINIGKQYLLMIALGFWIFNIMMTFNGVIRGLGDTLAPMLITLISLWVIKVPVAYYLSISLHEVGVWASEPISWAIGALSTIVYYRIKCTHYFGSKSR